MYVYYVKYKHLVTINKGEGHYWLLHMYAAFDDNNVSMWTRVGLHYDNVTIVRIILVLYNTEHVSMCMYTVLTWPHF